RVCSTRLPEQYRTTRWVGSRASHCRSLCLAPAQSTGPTRFRATLTVAARSTVEYLRSLTTSRTVRMRISAILCIAAMCVATESEGQGGAAARRQPMGFFITSVGPGDGANLGGLAGADAHCQRLAESAGTAGREWRAYLSATAAAGQPPVNARDRIGDG